MYAFPFGTVEKTCLKTKPAATSRKPVHRNKKKENSFNNE